MAAIPDEVLEKATKLRHRLHAAPELSNQEHDTARRITAFLEDHGPDSVRTGIGGTGVLATFDGNDSGKHIVIRAELDALPIQEQSEIAYRSERDGVSHMCGHDGHMAIVAGLAPVLKDTAIEEGSVSLLFQPAEETGEGAKQVLDEDVFLDDEPDHVFALHNVPGYEEGSVVVREGSFASASRGMTVDLVGEPSHAAHPDEGNSPASALASLLELFTAFDEHVSLDAPFRTTVVHSQLGDGAAFGTTPGNASISLTLRTPDNGVMEKLCGQAEQNAGAIAGFYDLESSISWHDVFHATVNDTGCVQDIEEAAEAAGQVVVRREEPFAWSEDFGRFTSRFQGAMFGLGAGRDRPPLHSETYDFPDQIIRPGMAVFLRLIDRYNGLRQL